MKCLNCRKQEILIDTEICPGCKAYMPSLLRDILKNKTLLHHNNYQIEYPLGRGGFGVTYRATHINLEEPIAIKEFYPSDYAARNSNTNTLMVAKPQEEIFQRNLDRFKKEGRILAKLAKLRHPSIVQIMDLFEENNTAYLVMELLEGETLRDKLDKSNNIFKEEEVLTIFNSLVEALDVIHKAGIYHLDIKPENIIMSKDNRIVLIDFGSAKQKVIGINNSTRSYTESYVAPEIMSGKDIGPESDIFELGMVMHELLTRQMIPKAMERLLEGQTKWEVKEIVSPWKELIENAVILKKEQRPKSVKEWWSKFNSRNNNIEITEVAIPIKSNQFSFKTVTVDKQGKIVKQVDKKATQIIEELGNGIILEMVEIPGGSFMMGSPEGKGYKDEKPQHKVTVPTFYMGKYQVTQEQWEAVMGSNPSWFKGSEKLPVESISWYKAVEFCKRLSEKTKKIYRLPSEAEWEYACRAGTETEFAFGETINTDIVNYNSTTYGEGAKREYRGKTTIVGSLGVANEFGLYDMHGNVWEWCQDKWHDSYEGAPTDGSAWEQQEPDNISRVLRGGSWYNIVSYCRSAFRGSPALGSHDVNRSLRVVLVAKVLK